MVPSTAIVHPVSSGRRTGVRGGAPAWTRRIAVLAFLCAAGSAWGSTPAQHVPLGKRVSFGAVTLKVTAMTRRHEGHGLDYVYVALRDANRSARERELPPLSLTCDGSALAEDGDYSNFSLVIGAHSSNDGELAYRIQGTCTHASFTAAPAGGRRRVWTATLK